MRDFGVSVLEQYAIDVKETQRVRGGLLVKTQDGIYMLREQNILPERLQFLICVYQMLEMCQEIFVDTPIKNKDDEYLTKAEDGTTYLLRKWFQGSECDIKKEQELIEGAKILAQIHKYMRLPAEMEVRETEQDSTLQTEYERHNRELRKVYTFVRGRSVKNEFEAEFLKGYHSMYAQAQNSLDKMREAHYIEVCEIAKRKREVVHGDYNYHNILFGARGAAITVFDHAHIDTQLADFYYYLRKVLEKYHYEERLGYKLLRAYDSEISLGRYEREYLAIRLSYPEKFWKISNAYYHSNKAWIPRKNVEKLRISVAQSEEKKMLLKHIFEFDF